MSYEILKSIKIDEKKNSIVMQFACNNIYPKIWHKSEYYADAPTFKNKIIAMLADIAGGNLQPNRSLYKLNYAFTRALKELELKVSFYDIYHKWGCPIYYDKEKGKPHYAYTGEEYALSSEQIESGEFEICESILFRYHKKSDLEKAEQDKIEISNKFYDLFMKYYHEKVESGLFCLDKDGLIIRPISQYRYQYGYSLTNIQNSERLKKSWAMEYHKAFVLASDFNAKMIKIV